MAIQFVYKSANKTASKKADLNLCSCFKISSDECPSSFNLEGLNATIPSVAGFHDRVLSLQCFHFGGQATRGLVRGQVWLYP